MPSPHGVSEQASLHHVQSYVVSTQLGHVFRVLHMAFESSAINNGYGGF